MILRRLPVRKKVQPAEYLRQYDDPAESTIGASTESPWDWDVAESVDEVVPDALDNKTGWRRWLSQQGRTLHVRLSVLTSLVVILSIAIITIAAYATVHEILFQETDKQLQTHAQSIIDSGVSDTSESSHGDNYHPAFRDSTSTLKMMVIPPKHAGIYTDDAVFEGIVSDTELAVIRGYETYAFRSDGDQRYFSLEAPDGRIVVVATDTTVTERALDSLSLVLILVFITGSLGAIVIGVAVATAGLQPITRLRRAADRVSATGKLRQLPVYSKDELGALTQSFNNMMKALERSREKQKELVADASHELKTPLTSLRTNIELLLLASRSGGQGISAQDRKDIERDVMAQLDEMSELIGDLVDLAREDGPSYVTETINLNSAIDAALARAQRRRPDVNFDVHDVPWTLEGDSATINRALVNLLDNAAKWSPENGTVRVWMEPITADSSTAQQLNRCRKQPKTKFARRNGNSSGNISAVEIRVADSGPGIPKEDRDKIFDRFYRSIQSRSMPGSGLGLAIVKQVIDRHGGAIVADESDDGGALIRVVLPGRVAEDADI